MDPAKLRHVVVGTAIAFVMTTLVVFLVVSGESASLAGDKGGLNFNKAYKLYQAKCLGCHVSVADPEKSGRTRDGWFVVVNVMHDRGVELTPEESGMIVDLLYALRKGMERDPG
jgi:hypothetical protein